jgi:hypothetical protein
MKFFLRSITYSLAIGMLIIFLISRFITFESETWVALGVGLILALIYVFTGFVTFSRAIRLKQKIFNIVFLSSIFVRLLLMAVILILLLKFCEINKALLLIALFCWYFIFQIWEVVSLNRMTVKKV